ncbi:UDP-N-acetylmuramoyl-L-alanyl-D-glutamate--2,6-diaminopimelate ligase [Natroniella acetigena]|uniref:UDP-N-acetylmuramoyl-L-alanyl-D-glutamate--2, 6-diaminopimelate ligase n=1 Tax=Natroniella acetigena TaxID=52004 RepID=UPI00200A7DF1|nr:UDP-N-acetylmuramoyl-L-alanyl-D-glutamate--2,6-diaminopimelate ligase [Natroniella acetigena]MCK8827202.1 UDP-N-acetylmuramoyl-L-alanyl-D-glutamate--2,6-diaminopimelate ligase [Natroniella acetigena]
MSLNSVLASTEQTLSDLIKDLQIINSTNFKESKINNITNNSKGVAPGSLFVAINGFNTDGHRYIMEAVSQGAITVIGEREVSIPQQIPYLQVEDARKALAELSGKFYGFPSQKLNLIGVTGTTGKTTTTMMIDHIINQLREKTGLIGTLHTKIGDKYYSNPNQCTTPESTVLNQRLARMEQEEINYVSMEVSSHSLKLNRVWGLDFDLAIFTNLSRDHLNFHQTLEDYYTSKEKLFTELKEDKIAICNSDDDYTERIIKNTSAISYTYGIKNSSDLSAADIKINKQGIKFKLKVNNNLVTMTGKLIKPISLEIKMPITGYHNIYNALAAFLACSLLGFPVEKIKSNLESFTGVRRRMELIYDQEFSIIDDFAHNPSSLNSNFKTIEKLDYNNLVIIHFLKGKRGIKANQHNAQIITTWANKLNLKEIITTRAEEEVIQKNKVLSAEEDAFTKIIAEEGIKITTTANLEPALQLGLNKIESGDLLLLLGGPGLNNGKKILNDLLI